MKKLILALMIFMGINAMAFWGPTNEEVISAVKTMKISGEMYGHEYEDMTDLAETISSYSGPMNDPSYPSEILVWSIEGKLKNGYMIKVHNRSDRMVMRIPVILDGDYIEIELSKINVALFNDSTRSMLPALLYEIASERGY